MKKDLKDVSFIMKMRPLIQPLLLIIFLVSCNRLPTNNYDEVLPSSTQSVNVPEEAPKTLEVSPTPTHENLVPASGELPVDKILSLSEVDSFPFNNQTGTPINLPSWLYGCNWLGVAGQVFDSDGHPLEFLIVEAGGTLDGQPILGLSLVGTIFDYGPGGYEVTLSDQTIASSRTVWIQLKDLDGVSLSPKIFLDTIDDCDQNLTLLNFSPSNGSTTNKIYFPLLQH